MGIGVGAKLSNGKPTGKLSIRIYVASKIPLQAIPKKNLLPKEINGIATDVVEIGRLRKFAPTEQRRHRPARPGCSVGFAFPPPKTNLVMAGTFGAVVGIGKKRFILSNNHVLADEGALAIGSPIFEPGLLDNGSATKDRIASLTQFVPLSTKRNNKVDCAIAELRAKTYSATVMPKVGKLKSALPISAVPGMKVHKVGRTTGYTIGEVQDVSADVTVTYDAGPVRFEEQIIIVGTPGSFSDSGDSGSMIVDRGTQRATGLLFAGSTSHTIANHMEDVLAALAADLVI